MVLPKEYGTMSKFIKINETYKATVDEEDYIYLSQFKWNARMTPNTVYATSKINGKTIQMHRLIMQAPKCILVDHKDRNGLNNIKENLRFCTYSQNLMNSHKPNGAVSSKFKGVVFDSENGIRKTCWKASICINGKRINLGRFRTEIEAARAYNEAAILHFKDFARLNELD